MASDTELEKERLVDVSSLAEWSTGTCLTTGGYHEVAFLAHVLQETVEERLLGSPCVVLDSEAYRLAARTAEMMYDLSTRLYALVNVIDKGVE